MGSEDENLFPRLQRNRKSHPFVRISISGRVGCGRHWAVPGDSHPRLGVASLATTTAATEALELLFPRLSWSATAKSLRIRRKTTKTSQCYVSLSGQTGSLFRFYLFACVYVTVDVCLSLGWSVNSQALKSHPVTTCSINID